MTIPWRWVAFSIAAGVAVGFIDYWNQWAGAIAIPVVALLGLWWRELAR